MSESPDVFAESIRTFASADLTVARKVHLVKKLLRHRKDPRVGDLLLSRLAKEDDPEVLKTIILGLGLIRNPDHVPVLKGFLKHPSFRVLAATLQTLCKMNSKIEAELIHPLLCSKDKRVRSATIVALVSNNPQMGEEVLQQLATSDNPMLRRTSMLCAKTLGAQRCEALLLSMFCREQDLELAQELAGRLLSNLTAASLERLLEFKLELAGQLEKVRRDDEATRATLGTRLGLTRELVAQAYKALEVSSGTIGRLEGTFDRELAAVAAKLQHAEAVARRAEAPPPPPPSVARRIAGPFALLVATLGTIHFAMSGVSSDASAPRAQLAATVTKTDLMSKLGRVGDPVSVEAKVIQVHAAARTVGLATTSGVMVFATFEGGVPAAARLHNKVKLEGRVSGVRTEVSVYVAGSKLTLTEA